MPGIAEALSDPTPGQDSVQVGCGAGEVAAAHDLARGATVTALSVWATPTAMFAVPGVAAVRAEAAHPPAAAPAAPAPLVGF